MLTMYFRDRLEKLCLTDMIQVEQVPYATLGEQLVKNETKLLFPIVD